MPGARRPRRWRAFGAIVLLTLMLGVASYLISRPMRIAGPAPPITADKKPTPAPTPDPIPATPPSPPAPKLVVGLPHLSEPADEHGIDQTRSPNSAPEPHYAVGLPPISAPPVAAPVEVALPPEAPAVTAPVRAKPSPKRPQQGPSTGPTSGQVRF